jgi:hypothetical protein
LKAKTSYRRRRIELIVERLEAELEAERREVEPSIEIAGKLDIAVEVASIEVVAKVGRMRLYSEVAEKVGQADPYASNLLAFLEDSEVEAVAERIEIAGKLDTAIEVANIVEVAGKLDLQNSEEQNSEVLDS